MSYNAMRVMHKNKLRSFVAIFNIFLILIAERFRYYRYNLYRGGPAPVAEAQLTIPACQRFVV